MADEKFKVLIVDDDSDFREILSAKLLAAGFDVDQSPDGQTGIEKANSYHPHLILLDVHMPGMSGIEALSKMKADPNLKDIKVIFLTSYGEAQEDASWVDNKFAKELGAIAHIKKSDDLDKILIQINTALTLQ
jgi:CheY-like chemotaxis protein